MGGAVGPEVAGAAVGPRGAVITAGCAEGHAVGGRLGCAVARSSAGEPVPVIGGVGTGARLGAAVGSALGPAAGEAVRNAVGETLCPGMGPTVGLSVGWGVLGLAVGTVLGVIAGAA